MVVCNLVIFPVTKDRASMWYCVFELSIAFGLGLAVKKDLVELHGGSISARSEVDLTISLPKRVGST